MRYFNRVFFATLSSLFLIPLQYSDATPLKIDFIGSLYLESCTVSLDNTVVQLPNQFTNDFRQIHDYGKKVAFRLSLTDCPDSLSYANVTFTGNVSTYGNRIITPDTLPGVTNSHGVGLSILDNKGEPINLSGGAGATIIKIPLQNQAGTLTLNAIYVAGEAPENISSGAFQATAQYSISYQ